MSKTARRCITGFAVGLLALLAACYLPNHFRSEIRLGPTGDYALSFYGELIWAPLYRDIRQGHLSKSEIAVKTEEIRRDLARDSNFKKIEPMGDGSFKVSYEREGRLLASDMVTFVRRNAIILAIRATPDGLLTVNGNTLKPSDAQTATTMGLDVRGEFRVTTDGLVKEHNATMVKPFGRAFVYIWTIENAFSPAPHLVMQRAGAWPTKAEQHK